MSENSVYAAFRRFHCPDGIARGKEKEKKIDTEKETEKDQQTEIEKEETKRKKRESDLFIRRGYLLTLPRLWYGEYYRSDYMKRERKYHTFREEGEEWVKEGRRRNWEGNRCEEIALLMLEAFPRYPLFSFALPIFIDLFSPSHRFFFLRGIREMMKKMDNERRWRGVEEGVCLLLGKEMNGKGRGGRLFEVDLRGLLDTVNGIFKEIQTMIKERERREKRRRILWELEEEGVNDGTIHIWPLWMHTE
jgi:hypothetical protein